jgi:hypothetical protein
MPSTPKIKMSLDILRTKGFQSKYGLFSKRHQGKDVDVRFLPISQTPRFGDFKNSMIHMSKKQDEVYHQVEGGYTSWMMPNYKPPKGKRVR